MGGVVSDRTPPPTRLFRDAYTPAPEVPNGTAYAAEERAGKGRMQIAVADSNAREKSYSNKEGGWKLLWSNIPDKKHH